MDHILAARRPGKEQNCDRWNWPCQKARMARRQRWPSPMGIAHRHSHKPLRPCPTVAWQGPVAHLGDLSLMTLWVWLSTPMKQQQR